MCRRHASPFGHDLARGKLVQITFVISLVHAIAVAMAMPFVMRAALAQDAPDFRGKTVTIIASFEAGGPYDFYSRLIARHIGAHLPGNPTVVGQNMPGAGGQRGAHYPHNVPA